MPYYSDELIEEVRSRNDIVDVIGSYVHLQKKGSTYFGLCPFHNEKTGSFSVSPNKQMYYCFGCGAGGNVFTFLMQYENFTFPEAMQELADRVGIELPKQEMTSAQRREADRRTQLLEINKEAAKYFYMLLRGPRGQRAHEYFKKRELSDETMQKFGLGYSDQYSDDLYKYLRSKGYDDEILKETGLVTIDEVRGGHDKFWNPVAKSEEKKAKAMLKQLYFYYMEHIEELPQKYLVMLEQGDDKGRIICDYISGMTDQYATTKFHEYFVPVAWEIDGY